MIRLFLLLWSLFLSLWAQTPDLRVGFYDATTYAMKSADFRIGIKVWIKAFTKEQNLTIETRYYADAKKLAKDFEKGRLDMAVATPLVFVKYFDPKILASGIVGYEENKQKSMEVLILVRKADRHTPLNTLLKKRIAVPQVADAIQLYIQTLALKRGLQKAGEFILTKGESQAIYKLFFHKVDIAVVTQAAYDTAGELNPQVRKELAVYLKFHLYIGNFAFLRKGINPKIERLITDKAVKKLNTPRGQEVLIMFGCKTVEKCTPKDLEQTRRVYNRYLRLRKRRSDERGPQRVE